MKKVIGIILIIIGAIPLILPIITGIYSAINGYSGLCLWPCTNYYGFTAFIDSVFIYSVLLWPTYIIGIVLIVVGIILIKKYKRK
jgi:uncharacterized membrane protein